MLRNNYGGHLKDRQFMDKNDQLYEIIRKDWNDMTSFCRSFQFDLMLLLKENIDCYEVSIGYLKSCLRLRKLD